jgi:hypothetical protein
MQFDSSLNQWEVIIIASKPYTHAEVSKYYNLKAVNEQLKEGFWLVGKKIME